MFSLSIPNPCHEKWQNMQPTQRGAFCNACAKEVVDFTNMTDDEVKHYFINKKEQATCGRFRTDQLNNISIEIPFSILQKRMAGWKRFLAIVMISFGTMLFGCDVKTGKALASTHQETKGEPLLDSTEVFESSFVGGIVIIEDSAEEKELSCTETTGLVLPEITIGDSIIADYRITAPKTDSSKAEKKKLENEKIDTPNIQQKIPADTSACAEKTIYSK